MDSEYFYGIEYQCLSKKMIFIMQVLNQRRNYLTAFYSKQEWNNVRSHWQKWWKTIEKGTEGDSRRLVNFQRLNQVPEFWTLQQVWENQLPLPNRVGKSGRSWPQIFLHRCYLLLNKELSL